MSLINQVLNNLEKRGASTSIGEANIRVVPVRQSHGVFWLFVAIVSVAVLTATAWLRWGDEIQFGAPSVELATPPAFNVMQASSQPVATAVAPTEAAVPASSLNSSLNLGHESAALATKPLLIPAPVISAVSPNPAISLGSPQPVKITGSHYASDATVILRTPKGTLYAKRKIVMQDSEQIVISVNFRNIAGAWSVEVVNDSGHASDQPTSGQFSFTVQPAPAPAADSSPAQDKAGLPAAKAHSEAKPAPVALLQEGKVSKKPTQVTPQQQAENEFRKAYALMQQGQSTAAISGYETALQLDAGHIVARQTLVRLLLDNKRSADAERLLQQGLQLDPKQSSLAMLLARMQVGRNELPQALETMQKSLPYAEKQADYQAFVAALLQRQNRHKEAIAHFQSAVQLSPQSGVWLMGLGISLRAEQRNAESGDAFNRALETHTLSAELQSFVKQQLKEL